MKNRNGVAVLITLTLTVLLAGGCTSHRMMMSDHSTMAGDGSMMMMNGDGSSRAMTEQEMHDHMAMMMNDARFASMMSSHCQSMGKMSNGSMPNGSMSADSSMSSGSMASDSSMPSGSSMASGSMASGSSMPGSSMMVMNSDGTSRAMTDSEMRAHMDMMMKNGQMSQMMMTQCHGM